MSFFIGPHEIAIPAVLAPMSGVTDLPFRRQAQRFGAGMVVSEMVASDALARGRIDMVRKAAADASLAPRVIQLAGRQAEWMAEGARIAQAAGADIVDINMGCPARQVTKGLSGSALMRDLDHAMTLIEATLAAVSIPVTLKMRLGWDHDCLNAPELARRAVDAGVAMITVHGRTRQQFYTGQADWSAVRAVREAVQVPLLVNGDIATLAQASEALTLSGADGVMVGRAAQGRPWLVGEIGAGLITGTMPDTPWAAKVAALMEQSAEAYDFYGDALGVRMMRKHFASFLEFDGGHLSPEILAAIRDVLCRSREIAAIRDALHRLLDHPPGQRIAA
ncbi:tRNA dihydrouridine synthase DusB [uncultured Maricaulis sp.]|uniref:tRNA dihydrouridine synthase DusB n=1 Tax=uncultured Maricaulis sp. TaxID=174710 RepID=UPI0030DCD382|tara:strand:- start:324 stop:1328 length:1005 start_codon:yes stop_codon:yes gene_type:complete